MIKAIIFDMDGVIFDSEKLWKKALADLKKKYNLSGITESVRKKSCGMDLNQQYIFFKQYMPENLDVRDFSRLWREQVLEKLYSSKIDITKPGFTEIFEYVKNKKYKIGLNSGSPRDLIKILFKRAGMDEEKMFDTIISGDDLTLGKPHPEGYEKACKKLGLKPEECLVFEDSINGIISALDAGCKVINVLDQILPPKKLQKKCMFVAKSFDDALAFLTEKNI